MVLPALLVGHRGRRPPFRVGSPAQADRDAHADRDPRPPARREPLRQRPGPGRQAAAGRGRVAAPDRAHARRDLQRPRAAADGKPRQPLRTQRTADAGLPRFARQAPRAEPADREPRAPDPGRVHPRDDAEPARGSLDPVRGARLVQPRQERGGGPVDDPARRRRPVADSIRCRSSARGSDPSSDPNGPPTFVTADTHWWDGSQIYGSDPAFASAIRSGENGKLRVDAERPRPAGDRGARRPHRRRGQLLGRARDPALAVHARAQRDLRPPARGVPGARRRRPLRQGAARERGADGEDPHRRLDAGDHRPPDHGHRHARQLVGAPRRGLRQAVRPPHAQRAAPRHPRFAQGAPRRALLAHRGVRRRLPDAPAAPGRVRVPRARATTT